MKMRIWVFIIGQLIQFVGTEGVCTCERRRDRLESPWAPCSLSCGEGIQYRTIKCGYSTGRMCYERETRTCNNGPCSGGSGKHTTASDVHNRTTKVKQKKHTLNFETTTTSTTQTTHARTTTLVSTTTQFRTNPTTITLPTTTTSTTPPTTPLPTTLPTFSINALTSNLPPITTTIPTTSTTTTYQSTSTTTPFTTTPSSTANVTLSSATKSSQSVRTTNPDTDTASDGDMWTEPSAKNTSDVTSTWIYVMFGSPIVFILATVILFIVFSKKKRSKGYPVEKRRRSSLATEEMKATISMETVESRITTVTSVTVDEPKTARQP